MGRSSGFGGSICHGWKSIAFLTGGQCGTSLLMRVCLFCHVAVIFSSVGALHVVTTFMGSVGLRMLSSSVQCLGVYGA